MKISLYSHCRFSSTSNWCRKSKKLTRKYKQTITWFIEKKVMSLNQFYILKVWFELIIKSKTIFLVELIKIKWKLCFFIHYFLRYIEWIHKKLLTPSWFEWKYIFYKNNWLKYSQCLKEFFISKNKLSFLLIKNIQRKNYHKFSFGLKRIFYSK